MVGQRTFISQAATVGLSQLRKAVHYFAICYLLILGIFFGHKTKSKKQDVYTGVIDCEPAVLGILRGVPDD